MELRIYSRLISANSFFDILLYSRLTNVPALEGDQRLGEASQCVEPHTSQGISKAQPYDPAADV